MNVNIKAVAAAAGVAQSTVSRVMNNSGYVSKQTQHKVLKAMEDLGYSPSALAVGFSKSQTRIIGFIVPDIRVDFFTNLLYAADKLATQKNYRMILCNSNESADKERTAIQDLLSYKVGGILIVPVENSPNADIINRVHSSGIPIVCIDKEMPNAQCDQIYIDNQKGAREITQFALEKGHRDICFLIYDSHVSVTASYIQGIESAFHQKGMELVPERIFTGTNMDDCSDFVAKQYHSSKRPSAFISLSSDFTVICYRTLIANHANIPDEVDLIGYDKMKMLEPFGYKISNSPSPADMGTIATRMLFSRMEAADESLPVQYVILPTSVSIDSVK